jgi:hypothetical protein
MALDIVSFFLMLASACLLGFALAVRDSSRRTETRMRLLKA